MGSGLRKVGDNPGKRGMGKRERHHGKEEAAAPEKCH